jgi:hypothetical protein
MSDGKANWSWLFIAALLPVLLMVVFDVILGHSFPEETFKRFANALLTSYVLAGILLTGNLFFYAGSRQRPLAPIVGMGIAILAGIAITVLLLSQDELLMEANGSVQAQILVSAGAMALSATLVIGSMFAAIVSKKPTPLFDEEE